MKRLFPMTEKAKQALWCKVSTGASHIPTQFLVEGDAKEGYEVSHVDNELSGFTLLPKVRTLYAVKRIVEQINTTGTTDMRDYCTGGSFAWSHVPIEKQ